MSHVALHVTDLPAGIALEPGAIELLGSSSELNNEVAGEILWLGFAPFLPPEAEQGGFIVAHNDSGIRAADEGAAAYVLVCPYSRFHLFLLNEN
jgi:hypothetical protein